MGQIFSKKETDAPAAPTCNGLQDEQSGSYSLFCTDMTLKNESAVVSLCSVPCIAMSSSETHAVIIIELMDYDGRRELYKADFNPIGSINFMCQEGRVARERIAQDAQNDEEIQQAADYIKLTQNLTVRDQWEIEFDRARQLLNNIRDEIGTQDTNYSLTGQSIESSVKGASKPLAGDFHNCVTWARHILSTVDIAVDESRLPKAWRLTMIYTTA